MTSGHMTTVTSWSFQGRTGASSATFSPCGTYRYELRRSWDGNRPLTIFIGLNPSVADSTRDDNTCRREIDFAARLGAGAYCKLNIFGLRSTQAQVLYSHAEPIGPDNDAAIERVLRAHRDARLVVAWGAHGGFRGRGDRVGEMVMDIHGSPECFGLTQGGFPFHPLYLPKTSKLRPWRPR